MAIKNEIDKGHVYYFEPNDTSIGKDQDGGDVALMPHLEDLCIAMTLTADIYPRDKACIYNLDEGNKSQMVRRSLSWISYVYTDSINVSKQLINSGVKMGDDNYLTTYYTEISADNYIENELVEGFGVTNVSISFESWLAPIITISFVDVHGSCLWGREEAIHDNGEITSDNLLGVFFTQPYPLFRLQVKGFLGHDVTYQLSVKDFRGRYNSQTGNFEATATFIGYTWSLLTDIPLKLLSVVSELSYVGKQYWDSHVSSPEWAMINADGTRTPPVKLYKLIQDIRSAVGALDVKDCINCQGTPDGTTTVDGGSEIKDPTTENRNVSNEAAAKINAAKDVKNDLGKVSRALENFITQCKNFTEKEMLGKMIIGTSSVNGEEEILMLFNGGEDGVAYPNDMLRTTYLSLNNAIDEYNEKHKNDQITNGIKDKSIEFHNNVLKATNKNLRIQSYKIFEVSNKDNGKQKVALCNNGNFSKLKINNQSLFKDTAEKLESLCNAFNNQTTTNITVTDGFGDYAFLLRLGTMSSKIATNEKRLTSIGENIETKIQNAIALQSNSAEYVRMKNNLAEGESIEATEKLKITAIIGFEPTIGNFVKLLMCHLETFIEVMMHCGDEIYKKLDKRTPHNYGIHLDTDTDISKNNKAAKSTKNAKDKPIWPWPTLYNSSIKENSETTSNCDMQYETLGWTNDYPPTNEGVDWEEQKVILSFLNAIERYDEKANIRTSDFINTFKSLPMSGSDLFSVSPFKNVAKSCKDIETLSAYLGLRIANVIGVADNKCSTADAEAIGYMDALNLISSSNDYDKLKNAVTSKEANQDFVAQVINFLTCKNKIRQTSETENGKKYNLFETILPDSGNEYSEKRHPMFVEDGDNYKYTYAYANSLDDSNANSLDDNGAVVTDNKKVSLIPTELYEFTSTNQPYTKLFVPNYKTEEGKKKLDFIPTITNSRNGDAKQNFVYATKTNNVIPTDSIDGYTNSDLFFVNTDVQKVSDIVRQLQSIKNGNSKFKDYSIKGEKDDNKVKLFMDRRYKVSLDDYYSIYNFDKNYRILMPALSKVDNDYYKTHLCNSIEQKYHVEYDTQWSTDTNSDLYKKTNLRVKDAGTTFANGTTEYSINDVLIGELPIFINSKVKGALFSSQIYYQQNYIGEKNNIGDKNLRDKAKAYLILSSMMSGVDVKNFEKDLFKSDDKSVIKLIPPFYVYFIGALLWRRSQKTEPLFFGDYKNSCPDRDTSFISKEDNIFYIDTNNKKDWYSIADYYMEYKDIDIAVRNKLIKLFENFAISKDYQLIRDNSELRSVDKDNPIINGEVWKNLRTKWSNNNFDTKSAEQWSQIFGNMYDKYSSITVPSSTKSILRLLYNENNKAMQSLRTLYGLNGGFLVGRGTTERVGLGNNEVTVTKGQMKGYLRGFLQRINDAQKIANKTNSEEVSISTSEVNRDYAVVLYYSLKHLWDAWLITSARDQFTIKNFFNKYFVFIDSFYMNVYNTIKLNPKLILDAYDAKDPSLLSYMSNVIKDEKFLLFSLPSFADSNILKGYGSTVSDYRAHNDMSWKKENLAKLFTPISFNEMGPIEVNNVFVFIYTHPYSNNASENNDKKFDSYMITDTVKWPDALNRETLPQKTASADRTFDDNDYNLKLHPNNSIPDDTEELVSARYGYMMPCFGVTVNRGNNYIFKAINVSMESPKVTAIAAQTYDNILSKTGADSSRCILFHGQDIYSVYAQYSYACEIEMMGCAQIQPLMYFQLLNIPMWRGTYMIYKVTHSLSPGTMTTKFTGVKMSRYQAPYATGYFTIVKKPAQTSSSSNSSGGVTSDNSQTETGVSTQTQFAVGGIKMVRAIFGKPNIKGFKTDGSDYDKHRGIVVKKDKHGNIISKREHWHCGTDIPEREGAPLYAPWNGYVKIAKNNAGSAGNYLMFVDNSNQVAVVFMHCMKLNVKKGDKVLAGGLLAYLGKTGGNAVTNAPTTPHLHLELYINGKLTMGESTRHGGQGTHVNPANEYGYIGET